MPREIITLQVGQCGNQSELCVCGPTFEKTKLKLAANQNILKYVRVQDGECARERPVLLAVQ